MEKKKRNAPIQILVAVVGAGKSEMVARILNKERECHHVVFRGKGSTTNSDLADFFGFGLRDSETVVAIVRLENSEDLVEEIATKLKMHISKNGIVFTVPIDSATSSTLKMLEVKKGDIR